MTSNTTINDLIKSSGNCVNLGRHMQSSYPQLYQSILNQTQFLNQYNPKFNERVYCVVNNITHKPLNTEGNPARFINLFAGYSLLNKRKPAAVKPPPAPKPPRTRKTALQEFINRTRRRNAHLYEPAAVEGVDYVVCPASNERMVMIKRSYISTVLGMTVDQYDTLYPGARKCATSRTRNISAALAKIDPTTGLTKHQLAVTKTKQALSSADSSGLTGYQKKGQKTRATHMARVDEQGRNGYQRQVHKRLTTILENGLTVEQNAHIKQKETLVANAKTGTGGASLQSKIALRPILEFLNRNEIKYYFDLREYGIKDTDTGDYYFWDLTIPDFMIAIEYQSSAWHANPCLSEAEWAKWAPPRGRKRTASEVLEYDYNKARSLYKHRGMVTYYVWQASQKQDVEDILCLLKTMNLKS